MNHLSKQFSPFIPQVTYLKMLVIFGSRGRGEAHKKSDWDFAVLYDEKLEKEQLKGWNWLKIYDVLANAFEISSDAIDVINLNHCSPLIAHYVARDGQLIYEQETGLFEQFKTENFMNQEELKSLRQVMRREIEEFLQNA
ncbi:DNA polymerase beta domain protein region [Halothece sp. PCC 7418]|uniref:type VII toxin-antitoxin system MntA family adenylyltransferase antitoxin n=1 Tax=Halothece sp. (strain PCC 7418) TaxID=65093 RepID=UPI0002A080FF|nr:nucleotidyltransferase domain-containing protein [Halothece sp. PCC 7418]AFZ42918.1 DNA polymerase beta domain protein region [Halothece sp. PCC 7418]